MVPLLHRRSDSGEVRATFAAYSRDPIRFTASAIRNPSPSRGTGTGVEFTFLCLFTCLFRLTSFCASQKAHVIETRGSVCITFVHAKLTFDWVQFTPLHAP